MNDATRRAVVLLEAAEDAMREAAEALRQLGDEGELHADQMTGAANIAAQWIEHLRSVKDES
jgi:hypothetical protein